MKKSRKNKRTRYNKKAQNNYEEKDIFNDFEFSNKDNESSNNNNLDNAAPFIDPSNNNKNLNEEEEDFPPAEDLHINSFNNYTNLMNESTKEKNILKLNNINIKYNKNDSKSLKYMVKVYKNQLQLNNIYTDCFILLEIKSKLLKMVSQQFYADDENSERLYISIYNFEKNFSENDFKQGKYIIIKEIFYKQYLDRNIGIRVDNPNNVLLFKNREEAYIYITRQIGDINEYLNQAESYLSQNNYILTMDIYLCCLELQTNDKLIKYNIYKKLIIFCLKINANLLALKYCNDYLLLYDKSNIDIIKYKIQSLINCRKFEEAKNFLDENKNFLQLEEFKKQEIYIKSNLDNTKGIFDLTKIKGGDVSDYLNPKIGFDLHENKGNRLIAKEDIFKGELLIVSKAFYFLTFEQYLNDLKEYYQNINYKRYKNYYFDKMEEFKVEPEFYVYENLYEQKKISEKDFEKLLDLDDFDNWNIKYSERAKKYPDGQTPNLANIANINSIRIYSSIFSCEKEGYGYGLWYYPSFINYSCNPNTLEFGIKDIYFLYAQRDIKKGEEITRRYFYYGLDIGGKHSILGGYGFICRCEICLPFLNKILLDKEKFKNQREEFSNLYDENISNKDLYKKIINIETLLDTNSLDYNITDLICFYFRAGYVLLNRKIYFEESEKYLNKAYILIEGKNFHFECIILSHLYILYY